MSPHKPTLAVYKFSSCDGCQLSILNMEDELLDLAGALDIAYFLEATRAERPGPYDIAIVEGSITTPHEVERIKEIRRQAKVLIALGTCATSGGIQALRNFTDAKALANTVYDHPEYLHYLDTATAIAEHVAVDLELWGCPVNKGQVLEVISALLNNRRPNLPAYSVCLECKRRGTICVLVDKGIPCIGPATQAGCGAICPTSGRGCYGCFGPTRSTNLDSLTNILTKLERTPGETVRLYRGISGYAPAFREIADELLKEAK
ncbi:MAG: oxidoreductase [Chloroflexi bacterium]|nr:oxidoreductase [Chloroflexota bacterium]